MKRLLMGLAVLPFLAGVAAAAQPLTSQQMDRVTAGFTAEAVADAEGLVGKGSEVLSATATLATATLFATEGSSETTLNIVKFISGSQSAVVTVSVPTNVLPGVNPN